MTNDITINLRQAFSYISNKGKYIVEFQRIFRSGPYVKLGQGF